MITLFTSCAPFKGDATWRQMNALRSWRTLNLPVIVIGDDLGAEEAAGELGYLFIPDVPRSANGIPYVDALFETALSAAETEVVAYVNADIVLLPRWVKNTEKSIKALDRFLSIGYCYEFDPQGHLDFSPGWEKQVVGASWFRNPWARDYFVFPRSGLWPFIPPFELGRAAWDTWLRKHVPEGAELVNRNKKDNFHQKHVKNVPEGNSWRIYNKELEAKYA